MLEVYNQNLAVAPSDTVSFDGKNVESNTSATLADDGQTIVLSRYGIYSVNVNAYGASTSAGSIGLQLMANGTAVARASSTATTAAGDEQAIGFNTLVKVNPATPPSLAKVTLQYTGTAGTLNLVNVVVTKVA